VIDFVKDEDSHIGSMVTIVWSIIEYEPLKLLQVYEGICFGHVMVKMCLHATNDDKVSTSLTLVNAQNKFKLICKKKLYGQKNKEKERKVGINFHWKWEIILKVENSHQSIQLAIANPNGHYKKSWFFLLEKSVKTTPIFVFLPLGPIWCHYVKSLKVTRHHMLQKVGR
jgi:hypothetical protein